MPNAQVKRDPVSPMRPYPLRDDRAQEASGVGVALTSRPQLQMRLPTPSTGPIQILIADDHTVVREGLTALLTPHSDFLVVGAAQNGWDAVRLAIELVPDVMLLDRSLPDLSAMDVMRELRGRGVQSPRTILYSSAVDNHDVLSFLRLGGRGVLSTDAPTAMIFKSIRKVHRGEVWIGRDVMGDIVAALTASGEPQPAPPREIGLTPREREVLQLVFEGETNKGIANRLAVAEDTIKHHLTNIFDKTGASNRLELVRFALYHGLLTTS
jgi:two-component system, NarL family, nitrate/nitrite response regulator NarL